MTITQKELRGEEDGRLTYLWLIVMVLSFMLYGLYTWGVYPFKQESALPAMNCCTLRPEIRRPVHLVRFGSLAHFTMSGEFVVDAAFLPIRNRQELRRDR